MENVLFIVSAVAAAVIIVGLIVAIAKQREAVANLSEQVRILDSHIDETWDVLDVLKQDIAAERIVNILLTGDVAQLKEAAKPVRKPAVRKPAVKKTVAKKEAK